MTVSRRILLTAGFALVMLGAGPALAGRLHSVKTAPSPSKSHGPIEGGGTWLVNKPSGYYLGRVAAGAPFDNEFTSPGTHWHYGRAATAVKLCAWAMPRSLGPVIGAPSNSCSARTREYLSHRQNFGKDFNARAHKAKTGTSVELRRSCELRYNYFRGTKFAGGANGGHWADSAGTVPMGRTHLLYRFTTLDGKAAVVRDPFYGWGFLESGCLKRPFRFAVHHDGD